MQRRIDQNIEVSEDYRYEIDGRLFVGETIYGNSPEGIGRLSVFGSGNLIYVYENGFGSMSQVRRSCFFTEDSVIINYEPIHYDGKVGHSEDLKFEWFENQQYIYTMIYFMLLTVIKVSVLKHKIQNIAFYI